MSDIKVLVFGSMNYDYIYTLDHFVLPKETISCTSFNKNLGGKGFNQAIGLARANTNTYMAGKVGNDGKEFIDYLNKENINTKYVLKDDNKVSGHAIIEVVKGENRIIINGGTNAYISKEEIDDILNDFDGKYLLLQNEISNIPYIINKAYDLGMHIIMNLAPFNDEIFKCDLDKLDLIIVNEIEAKCLAKCDSDNINEIKDTLIKKYPNYKILMTIGELGAYFIDNSKEYYDKAIDTKIVDTTAAGDTFSAYFISNYLKDKDVLNALKIANRASSITVSRSGAAMSIPKVEEL